MTTKETKQKFITFLKSKKLYAKFIKAFNDDSLLLPENRFTPNKSTDLDEYFEKITPITWLSSAFTWCNNESKYNHKFNWDIINKEWYNLLNISNNEKDNNSSTAVDSDSL